MGHVRHPGLNYCSPNRYSSAAPSPALPSSPSISKGPSSLTNSDLPLYFIVHPPLECLRWLSKPQRQAEVRKTNDKGTSTKDNKNDNVQSDELNCPTRTRRCSYTYKSFLKSDVLEQNGPKRLDRDGSSSFYSAPSSSSCLRCSHHSSGHFNAVTKIKFPQTFSAETPHTFYTSSRGMRRFSNNRQDDTMMLNDSLPSEVSGRILCIDSFIYSLFHSLLAIRHSAFN